MSVLQGCTVVIETLSVPILRARTRADAKARILGTGSHAPKRQVNGDYIWECVSKELAENFDEESVPMVYGWYNNISLVFVLIVLFFSVNCQR